MKHKQIKVTNGKNAFWIPYKIKKDLDVFIDDMTNSKMDIVLIIDGKEGTGKSRNARTLGRYVSYVTKQPFSDKNIHFNTEDYIKASENGNRFQINVLDESREALNKKRSVSKSNVFFTNWLSENRDKNQVHILNLPAIHDLDYYISVWRMSMLIHAMKFHVESPDTRSGYKLVRGSCRVYENNKELQRYIFNKNKYGYYAYPKNYKYVDKFKDCEVFTPEELKRYEEKKAKKRRDKYVTSGYSKDRFQLCRVLKELNQKKGMTKIELSSITGFSRDKINRLINHELVKMETFKNHDGDL